MANASSTSQTSSPAPSKTSIKVSKKSKIIKLRLDNKLLARFASDTKPTSETPTRQNSQSSSKEDAAQASPSEPLVTEPASESNATPVPGASTNSTDGNTLAPPDNGSKKRGVPGPKPGAKRGAGAVTDGQPKPRGKPGPKKKPRL
jgi:hypothetical protein